MGRYAVAGPCAVMVDGRAVHYTRPDSRVIEVDDDAAAPLVESGALVAHGHPAAHAPAAAEPDVEGVESGDPAAAETPEPPAPAPRRGRGRVTKGAAED